jgi:molybdenum cofactor guanylyltransferase
MLRTAGIVLCGGESSRMGRPKAWLPFGGELMLPRVVRVLSDVVSPVVVVAAPGQELPPLAGDIILAHDHERGRGPLQGLAAGLAAMPSFIDAAFASSCDVPFLRPAFVRRMIDLLGDHAACVTQAGGFLHPLAAVYRREVLTVAEALLSTDRPQLTRLFDSVPTRVVPADQLIDVDPDLWSLRNVNTPAEYAAASRDLAAGS